MFDDTIAAIATPLGEAALAIVRMSGPRAVDIADLVFTPGGSHPILPSAASSHTLHYGRIARNGAVIDEVLLSVLRAPRTFTREDIIEITCHGGLLATRRILDALLERGARMAEPGEFTKRAFLNGRIDLAQAEAVADLIHAKTDLALTAAHEQLAGKLSAKINQLRDDLIRTLAHVEAHIDFPDEDITPDTHDQMLARLEKAVVFMDQLLSTANEGRILRRGIRAAIVGRPNAGKSSLLNQLLGHDRAIVSPIPGTTRDTIEETANIRGLPVVFVDTAGLRDSTDLVEREGIRRSHESIERAELILHVFDISESLGAEDVIWLERFPGKPRILVLNKSDQPRTLAIPTHLAAPEVVTCCLSGEGIESLKTSIKALIWSGEIHAEMLEVMINARHQDALRRAREAVVTTSEALRNKLTLELVALDLRIAVNAVGEVVGKTSTDDLLDSIFSQFCLGK